MLSLVLPTYNEAKNIESTLTEITAAIGTLPHEIIVADDDSPDGTWRIAESLRPRFKNLKVIRRTVNRGLSPAVVDGFRVASGDVLMVMDADGQHDPRLIPTLYEKVRSGKTIVVASRYVPGGSVGDWVSGRRVLSTVATSLAGWLSAVPVRDPLSGFFAVDRAAYRLIERSVHPVGFKILLEILAKLPRGSTGAEVPLHFRARAGGESKLSTRVQWQFLCQVARLTCVRVTRSLSLSLFLIVCALAAVILLPRIITLLPIYRDPALRANVNATIRAAAEREGMLLSGFSIREIASDHVDVRYRNYRRGDDAVTCMRFPFDHSITLPCGAL